MANRKTGDHPIGTPKLHHHPDLGTDAAAAIAHLEPPVIPDHIKTFAKNKTNAGVLAHQQKLAHVGLFLKHTRLQLIRLGCRVTLEKTEAGITFHVDYPTPTIRPSQPQPPLDDFNVGA